MATAIYCAIRSGQYATPDGKTATKSIVVGASSTRDGANKICAEWPVEQDSPWSGDTMWVQATELDGKPNYDL